ncbi:MAG: hypothetical protein WBQ03_08710 [Candidatus Sulfotelmatobacter sp.]
MAQGPILVFDKSSLEKLNLLSRISMADPAGSRFEIAIHRLPHMMRCVVYNP